MNTSGRQHGFLFYDFKMAKDFRGRSNKCNIVDVELKERDLRGCLSSTGIGDGMGWTRYAVLHPSSVLHNVTWKVLFLLLLCNSLILHQNNQQNGKRCQAIV